MCQSAGHRANFKLTSIFTVKLACCVRGFGFLSVLFDDTFNFYDRTAFVVDV